MISLALQEVYDNEVSVGKALAETEVPREEIFSESCRLSAEMSSDFATTVESRVPLIRAHH